MGTTVPKTEFTTQKEADKVSSDTQAGYHAIPSLEQELDNTPSSLISELVIRTHTDMQGVWQLQSKNKPPTHAESRKHVRSDMCDIRALESVLRQSNDGVYYFPQSMTADDLA